MNIIIWKKPDGTVATTQVFNTGFVDPKAKEPVPVPIEDHVATLIERGDIPADWEVVTLDYKGKMPEPAVFPNVEEWVWDGKKVVVKK